MSNLEEVLGGIAEALSSDNPREALERLRDDSLAEAHMERLSDLVIDSVGITCVVHCRANESKDAIIHVHDKALGWIEKNHNCQKEGDHAKFLSALVLWARDEAEKFMGVDRETVAKRTADLLGGE